MKMTSTLVKRTLDQLEQQTDFADAQVVPADNPAIPQLNELFGDHTFFLDNGGLHIVEPAEATPTGTQMGKVVKLASWRDAKRSALAPHKPQPTDVLVVLGSGGAAEEEDDAEDPDGVA